MSSNNIYRSNAEDCLRMAQTAVDDGDNLSGSHSRSRG
jgi:hypothetical protein